MKHIKWDFSLKAWALGPISLVDLGDWAEAKITPGLAIIIFLNAQLS